MKHKKLSFLILLQFVLLGSAAQAEDRCAPFSSSQSSSSQWTGSTEIENGKCVYSDTATVTYKPAGCTDRACNNTTMVLTMTKVSGSADCPPSPEYTITGWCVEGDLGGSFTLLKLILR